MASTLAVFAALAVLPAAAPAQAVSAAATAPNVEALMARYLADAAPVGVSVSVVRGDETLVRGGWGLADRNTKLPAGAETSYRLGSVSKQFTAALVMRLLERGVVGLDDPVETHFAQVPPKWRGVTVRQLLNHTSGVPEFTDTGSANWPKKLPPTGLLGLVSENSLRFTSGSKYEYSNTNYVILALIAERHYGKPLAGILDDELFTPLGLQTMRFCEDEYGANGQAQPYVRDGDRIEDAPFRSVAHSFGAGGICSTAGDVARWNRALHTGKVVSADSYALMTTPQGAAVTDRYGFGLIVRPMAGRSTLFHGGTVPGFIAINAWVPTDGISITILANTSPTPQTPLLFRDLTRIAFGQTVAIMQPTAGPPPDAAALRKYAGNYTIQVPGRPQDVRFWVDDGVLKSQAPGQIESIMRPVGEHAFGTANDWTLRFTFIVAGGEVTGFEFEQAGVKLSGVRKR